MRWFGINQKERASINVLLSILIVLLYFATSTPTAQLAMSSLYSNPIYRGHEKHTVALECAVSWNAAALPDMLKVLKERNVKITFFVSGEWAKENEELLKQMASDGHEIGTMGYSPMLDGSTEQVVADLHESVSIIESATFVKPQLYYSGTRDCNTSSRAADQTGLEHVLCTVDLLSGRGDAADILSRALDRPFDGSILLMQPTANAVQALPALIEGLTQQGYRITTVSGALGKDQAGGSSA